MSDTNPSALNCRYCEQPFKANKHNQQFCSDACRGKDYRQRNRPKAASVPSEVPPLPPPPRREPIAPPEWVNPDWLNQQHRTATQEKRYRELEQQVDALAQRVSTITEHQSWRTLGALVGGCVGLVLFALFAQSSSSSMRSTLRLWLVLLGLGLTLAGYQLGRALSQQRLQTDPAQQQQLASLQQTLADTQLLKAQQYDQWQASEAALDAIPRYERSAPIDKEIDPVIL